MSRSRSESTHSTVGCNAEQTRIGRKSVEAEVSITGQNHPEIFSFGVYADEVAHIFVARERNDRWRIDLIWGGKGVGRPSCLVRFLCAYEKLRCAQLVGHDKKMDPGLAAFDKLHPSSICHRNLRWIFVVVVQRPCPE